MSPLDYLIDAWRLKVEQKVLAHALAARRAASSESRFTVFNTGLTVAFLGLGQYFGDNAGDASLLGHAVHWIFNLAGVGVVVSNILQLVRGKSASANVHGRASEDYEAILLKLQQTALENPDGKVLTDLRKRIVSLDRSAPALPSEIWDLPMVQRFTSEIEAARLRSLEAHNAFPPDDDPPESAADGQSGTGPSIRVVGAG